MSIDFPERIKYWAPDSPRRVTSERAYYEHQIDSTLTSEREYMAPEVSRKLRTFYEDEETGILTRDVGKFEAWMSRVTPAPEVTDDTTTHDH